jgi:membrane protein DedA with SNARE-associated domain
MIVSIVAGLARIPVKEYLLYGFLGSLVRTSILAGIGWLGGKELSSIMELFSASEDHLLIILSAVLLSMLGAWIVLRQRKPKENAPSDVAAPR